VGGNQTTISVGKGGAARPECNEKRGVRQENSLVLRKRKEGKLQRGLTVTRSRGPPGSGGALDHQKTIMLKGQPGLTSLAAKKWPDYTCKKNRGKKRTGARLWTV